MAVGDAVRSIPGALDLDGIASLLPEDPQPILILVDGYRGRALVKVEVERGRGEHRR